MKAPTKFAQWMGVGKLFILIIVLMLLSVRIIIPIANAEEVLLTGDPTQPTNPAIAVPLDLTNPANQSDSSPSSEATSQTNENNQPASTTQSKLSLGCEGPKNEERTIVTSVGDENMGFQKTIRVIASVVKNKIVGIVRTIWEEVSTWYHIEFQNSETGQNITKDFESFERKDFDEKGQLVNINAYSHLQEYGVDPDDPKMGYQHSLDTTKINDKESVTDKFYDGVSLSEDNIDGYQQTGVESFQEWEKGVLVKDKRYEKVEENSDVFYDVPVDITTIYGGQLKIDGVSNTRREERWFDQLSGEVKETTYVSLHHLGENLNYKYSEASSESYKKNSSSKMEIVKLAENYFPDGVVAMKNYSFEIEESGKYIYSKIYEPFDEYKYVIREELLDWEDTHWVVVSDEVSYV